ncbi:MAG: histidinol-phosphatase [Alphaproteobacteria bacterium]|nr:histidinol-phosphatase [Alphaproteobacteria bacterium]
MSEQNFDPELKSFAHKLADAAGVAALRYFRADTDVEQKADASPVTRADREAETVMRALITEAYPDHGIMGEEYGNEKLEAEFIWVLDPIDGTRAFVNGIPLFATLVALVHDGTPIIGINAYPALGERWLGVAGEPTRHWYGTTESNPLRVRTCSSLAHARLCTTSTDMFDAADGARYARLKDAVLDTRFGTDAWAYAMVASGQTDIVAEANMQPYDYLSHAVVVAGAGGTITDWDGQALRIDSPGSVLAAGDGGRHAEALALLQTP